MTLPSSIQMVPEGSHQEVKLHTYSKDPWGPENMSAVRSSWDLSEELEAQLWDLQRRLSDVDHFKNEPETVLRFIVAPTGYAAAESGFRKMVEWRKENNVDTILQDYHPPQKLIVNANSTMCRGVDRDGDPIYIERGGAMDAISILKEFGREEALKCSIWVRELHTRGAWITEFEQKHGRRIKDVTVVYDLKGLSSKHMNTKVLDLFGEIMRITKEYYPGPTKRLIIIRGGFIFPYIWAIAKHFFRQQARDKMIFPGKDYLDVLDKHIDRSVLPGCIAKGGTGPAASGLPNIIGDDSPNRWWGAHATTSIKKVSFDSAYGPSISGLSLAETDDGSATSDDLSTGSNVSVSGRAIVKGHWEEQLDGESHIFTSVVA